MSTLSAKDSRVISKAFYQTLTAVSGGAFVISIAFLEKLVPAGKHVQCVALLIAAWALFTVSLIFVLVGFLLSLRWYYRMGEIIGRMAGDIVMAEEYTLREAAAGFEKFQPSRAPEVLSWLSIAALVGGICALVGFAASNLR